MSTPTITAAASGTFTIGGDLEVHRLGFGAMRITGPGIWGEPRDRARRAAFCGTRSNSASAHRYSRLLRAGGQ